MAVTSGQLRAARSMLGLSQPDVAARARISTMTLKRAEGSGGVDRPRPTEATIRRIAAALEKAGVIFIEGNGEGPGVRLRKRRR